MESKSNSRILTWINPNTIQIKYFDNAEVSLDIAKIDYELYNQFVGKKPVKKLIISGIYTTVDKEARNFIKNENNKRSDYIIAEAIVIHSLSQRILANFYFKIVKPKYPIKVFTDLDEAYIWLETIKLDN